MDRHIPVHCFRKHVGGAGIHAQEVYEKLVKDPELLAKYRETILVAIKVLKTVPVTVEEIIQRFDQGDIDEEQFIDALEQIMDKLRSLRQRVMAIVVDVRQKGAPFSIEQKDMIQELTELWGEIWQMEKHFSEYIADIYIKIKRGGNGGEDKGQPAR